MTRERQNPGRGRQRPTKSTPTVEVVHRDAVPTEREASQDHGALVATRDHDHIQEWAARHKAEPATGAETPTGRATVDVHDGGTRIRFNFPAAAPFRPISWDEWLTLFDADRLVFVYEPPESGSGTFGRRGDNYYRLVPASEWTGTVTASRSRTPRR